MSVWIRTRVDTSREKLARNLSRTLFEMKGLWKTLSENELGALLLNDATLRGNGTIRLIGGENKSTYKERHLNSTSLETNLRPGPDLRTTKPSIYRVDTMHCMAPSCVNNSVEIRHGSFVHKSPLYRKSQLHLLSIYYANHYKDKQ